MSTLPMTRPPTMRDIAAAAGVTYQAVSLALSGRAGVSDERRRQIQALADEMGYYPHAAAKMLSQKRTGQIGLISARPPNGRFSINSQQFVDTFIEACESRGRHYHVEFHHHSNENATGPFTPPHALAGGLVDGVILAEDVGETLRHWLTTRRIPFVSISEPAEYSVIADEAGGMRAALKHLISLGHRRISACFGPQRYAVHRLKRDAFFEVAARHKLYLPDDDYTFIFNADESESYWHWADRLLSRKDRPTAVVGGWHPVTQMALSKGLQVPRDLSLIEWARPAMMERMFHPKMAAIDTDMRLVMQHAFELLETLLAGKTPDQPHRRIGAQLIVAESTGPAPLD